MSNQNFDTNSPFSSSPQPLPIAQQLGTQAYMSQIQDKRHKLSDDGKEQKTKEVQQRFSAVSQPQETVSPRENKMDAFFRQAEEDEQREKERVKNADQEEQAFVVEQPESSSDSPNENQAAETPVVATPVVETPVAETPVVETPVVAIPAIVKPVTDSVNSSAEQPSVDNAIVQRDGSQIVSQQKESSFSLNSFGSSFASPSFGQSNQPNSAAPPSPEAPHVDDAAQTNSPAFAGQQTGAAPDPSMDEVPKEGSRFDVDSSNIQNTQQSDGESRNLTGSAALSAGMAAAGLGAWAHQLVNDKTDGNNGSGEDLSDVDASSKIDHSEQLRQQLADEERLLQSRGSLATFELSNNSEPSESQPQNALQSNVNQSGTSQPSTDRSSVDKFDNTQPNTDQSDVEANVQPSAKDQSSINVQMAEAMVDNTHSSEVHKNDSERPSVSWSQGSNSIDESGQSEPAAEPSWSPFTANQAPDSEASDNNSEATISNNSSSQAKKSPVEIVEELHVQQPDPEVENARLAAEQKAQQIKADRARMFADHEPVHARPYGEAIEPEDSSSASPERQVLVESAFQPSQPNQINTPAATSPSNRAQTNSQLIGDIVNPDGTTQRRPFPIELFNTQLLRNLRSGVVFVDHRRRVQLWSKGAETMTGIHAEAVIDRPLYPQTYNLRFDDGTAVSLEQCPVSQCLETMQDVSGDFRILNSTSHEVKIGMTISPVIDKDRYVNGAIIIFDDHSAEIDLQRQLKDLYEFSVLDPLTQVANRAEFERVLEEYVRAFNQSDSFNCSIIICDLDYFKSINDKFGHTVGDQALVGFAEMLKKYVRSQDLVARYGGEEFVILCADCDTDSALQRAEKIRMALFKTPQTMLGGKSISASFGVSELRQGDTAMEFFVRADTALLKAKELGRNRVVIADQRETSRGVSISGEDSVSGMQWRQQRREHTALVCEEFQSNTPVPVLVEKLRGFIIEKDAWLQRVDQEFLSMEVDFEDPKDYSRKGSFTLNIEFKEAEEQIKSRGRRMTYIRISIFPGRRKKWFSTNHTDVVKYLLSDLRSYLMINDEASHLTIDMATEDVRAN